MEGHEGDIAVRLFRLIHIGDERDLREEILKAVRPFFRSILEVLRHADEFAQIFEAIPIILLFVLFEGSSIPRFLDHVFDNLMERTRSHLTHKGKDQCGKILQCRPHLRGEFRDRTEQLIVCDEIKKRDAIFCRRLHHASKGGLTESALWDIDDAQKAQRITRIIDDAQIGDDVLDFAAVIETYRADHGIRNSGRIERFLDIAGLCIRTIENGDIAIFHVKHRMQTLHLAHDVGCFVFFGCSLVDDDGIACRIIRP